MRFMLVSFDDEQYWEEAGAEKHLAAMKEATALCHDLDRQGKYLFATPLQPARSATLVRVRDGRTTVTAGPYAESREVLGGFYIIEAESVEEAAEIAARHPGARHGTVEIRALLPLQGVPQAKL